MCDWDDLPDDWGGFGVERNGVPVALGAVPQEAEYAGPRPAYSVLAELEDLQRDLVTAAVWLGVAAPAVRASATWLGAMADWIRKCPELLEPAPDEPFAVVRAGEPGAAAVLQILALIRESRGEDDDRVIVPLKTAAAMAQWVKNRTEG